MSITNPSLLSSTSNALVVVRHHECRKKMVLLQKTGSVNWKCKKKNMHFCSLWPSRLLIGEVSCCCQ